MKIRLVLVALIVLGQFFWLALNYVSLSLELTYDASYIRVPAKLYSSGDGYVATMDVPLTPDNALLGKSIWWGDKWEYDQEITPRPKPGKSIPRGGISESDREIAPRPKPGDEVQGAVEIRLKSWRSISLLRDGKPLEAKDSHLIAIWHKGENDLWHVSRIVAPDSSEDILAEDEVRSKVEIDYWTYNKEKKLLTLHISPFIGSVRYELNSDMKAEFRKWISKGTDLEDHVIIVKDTGHRRKDPNATMELAVRSNKPPKATMLLYDGIPVPKAIQMMKDNQFPCSETEDTPQDQPEEEPVPTTIVAPEVPAPAPAEQPEAPAPAPAEQPEAPAPAPAEQPEVPAPAPAEQPEVTAPAPAEQLEVPAPAPAEQPAAPAAE